MLVDPKCFINISVNLHASTEVRVSIHNFLRNDFYSSKDIFKLFMSEHLHMHIILSFGFMSAS
jgi:hypothetical protein